MMVNNAQSTDGATVAIRECTDVDLEAIFEIVNDAAQAYRRVIPPDCWQEPYMPMAELRREIADGVRFWAEVADGRMIGVMGIQDRGEVCLIRHAYVRTASRQSGVGSALLRHLENQTTKPILIGTWSAASWAIRFYEKHGYVVVSAEEKSRLLTRFWDIPDRQVANSVVLSGGRYRGFNLET
jgi:GNAT superfamily N-acetyltransferase